MMFRSHSTENVYKGNGKESKKLMSHDSVDYTKQTCVVTSPPIKIPKITASKKSASVTNLDVNEEDTGNQKGIV